MTTTTAERAPTRSPLLRFLLRNFVLYNPLFLFSAMLVLGGAWLLNPPSAGNERTVPLLLKLLGVVQLYELTLLGAAALLARRGLTRDVRALALVLSPFLLDVTFTTSSLAGLLLNLADTWQGMLLLAAALVVTLGPLLALKLHLAARLTGRRFDGAQRATLLAGPLLVLLVPLVSAFLPLFGLQAEVGLVAGLGVAALTLAFARGGDEPEADTLRRLAPLALGGALIHACLNAWAYASPLSLVVGPVLVALGPALPRLAWPHAAARDAVTPALLPLLGALTLGLSDAVAFGLGSWQWGLLGMAAVHGVMLARTGAPWFLAGLLGAAHLAAGGVTPAASLGAVGHNPLEPALLLGLFGYGLLRRAHPLVVGLPLALAAGRLAAMAPLGCALDGVLALDVLGAGLLAWTHRMHGRGPEGARYRFAGVFLLFVPVTALALTASGTSVGDLARCVSRVSLVALLLPATFTRQRVYAWPALLLPLEVGVGLMPATSAGWGVAALLAGFGVVSLGAVVALQRERILSWLEQADAAEVAAGRPLRLRRPVDADEWARRVALAGALCLATGWVLAPELGGVPGRSPRPTPRALQGRAK